MFVPEDFAIPAQLSNDRLRLRMLSVADAQKDYEAVVETRTRLRKSSQHGWPRDGFTLAENTADLKRHEREFGNREAFAYTVVALDESRVLGCVYLNPCEVEHEAVVRFWVRDSERALLVFLEHTVQTWVADVWPFTAVRFENIG
ncbi:MAG: hypothetical protein O7G86_12660 [Gammaproteobacteria bacterium]|nr:hypothetical protein [Gammaproteobacteria bacterium]